MKLSRQIRPISHLRELEDDVYVLVVADGRRDMRALLERRLLRVGAPHRIVDQSAAGPSSSIIRSRILNFWGLPVAVSGSSVTKRTWRGTL